MIAHLSAYGRTTRFTIAAVLYLLAAAALTQVPLFNYLGYEFSALLTIPSAVISGVLTLLTLREERTVLTTSRDRWNFAATAIASNVLLLTIPLAVISFNAFFVKNCAYPLGLLYFLLLPVMSVIFSTALALVIGSLFRAAVTVFLLCVAGILGHILIITYLQPQLFAYNFILGFFPGITYDETLTDLSKLVLYRSFTFVAAVMFVSLFLLLRRTPSGRHGWSLSLRTIRRFLRRSTMLSVVLVSTFLLLLLAHLFRDDLGFEFSDGDIREALGRQSSSAHFILYYRNEDYTPEEMRRLKAEAEFHYRKVTETLRLNGAPRGPIEVYLYPDSEWKHRFIGTSTTNIAKPWRREMHITVGSFASTFRHELVHVLAAEFGAPFIDASLRMGWNEGLAVAVEWDEGLFSPHEYAAALMQAGALDDAHRLFTLTGFATRPGPYAYTVSGSFVRYLIERYGIERVRNAFPNGNVMGAFGRPLDRLLDDWRSFLRTVDASSVPSETVRALFFQPSIFYKVCAREVAAQNRRAVQALRSGAADEAERLFRGSFSNAASVFALRGLIQALNVQRTPDEVFALLQTLEPASSLRSHPAVRLLEGDAYLLAGSPDSAARCYDAVRSMMYSESFLEAAAVRLQCVKDSMSAELFHAIYYHTGPDSARGQVLSVFGEQRGGTPSFSYHHQVLSSSPIGVTEEQLVRFPEALRFFALKRSADERFGQGEFERAKALYWQAKNMAPTLAVSERLDDRIEACEIVPLELQ